MNTEIIAIADESGSMTTIKDDAEGAFNNFVSEQRDVKGECRMTLVKFSGPGSLKTLYQGLSIKEVPPLVLVPVGNTALFDAIGNTLAAESKRIENEQWAELVILLINTDGQENASTEFGLEMIKRMVSDAEKKKGWKVIYLASNQDAFKAAQKIGSTGKLARSISSDGSGQREGYAYASAETRSMREAE